MKCNHGRSERVVLRLLVEYSNGIFSLLCGYTTTVTTSNGCYILVGLQPEHLHKIAVKVRRKHVSFNFLESLAKGSASFPNSRNKVEPWWNRLEEKINRAIVSAAQHFSTQHVTHSQSAYQAYTRWEVTGEMGSLISDTGSALWFFYIFICVNPSVNK